MKVMRMPMNEVMRAGLGMEIIYSFIIILLALMIYFGTKKIYNLSSHKGIKYFRLSFLFFAIAYFCRSFIKFIISIFNSGHIWNFAHKLFGLISLALLIYFSTLAIFYLAYSIFWKKANKNFIYYIHIIAAAIAILSLITMNPLFHLVIQVGLFILIAAVAYLAHKRKTNMYRIYILIFIFWIINVLDILIPNVFRGAQLAIYLASIAVFALVTYKVLRKVGV
jgi:hypothetical protein